MKRMHMPVIVRFLEWPIRAIDTGGLPWTEIDFPADLERARDLIGAAPVARRS